jgi:hypothetical protein
MNTFFNVALYVLLGSAYIFLGCVVAGAFYTIMEDRPFNRRWSVVDWLIFLLIAAMWWVIVFAYLGIQIGGAITRIFVFAVCDVGDWLAGALRGDRK